MAEEGVKTKIPSKVVMDRVGCWENHRIYMHITKNNLRNLGGEYDCKPGVIFSPSLEGL